MWPFKKKTFSVQEMDEMENELKNSGLSDFRAKGKDLLEELKLKVEYTNVMPDEVIAQLLPISDANYRGLIKLRKGFENSQFAYIHEIIQYVFEVGKGKRVERLFERKKNKNSTDLKERRINYLTSAYIMPREEISKELENYDQARSRIDEIGFVRGLQAQYGQTEKELLQRVGEVRKLNRLKKPPVAEPKVLEIPSTTSISEPITGIGTNPVLKKLRPVR